MFVLRLRTQWHTSGLSCKFEGYGRHAQLVHDRRLARAPRFNVFQNSITIQLVDLQAAGRQLAILAPGLQAPASRD